MKWGGLLDFSTAGLPRIGDVDVGGPGLTTSDSTNETDLAWAGELEAGSFSNIGNGYNPDGTALPPGTVAGRGNAVSPIKHSGATGGGFGGGPGAIVNPGAVDSPIGDPAVWAGVVVFGGIATLYFARKDDKDGSGVVTKILVHGMEAFIFILLTKLAFQRWRISGISEVVEFV